MSEDPVGIAGGINLYQYVFNSPTNRTDPTGLTSEEVRKAQEVLEALCDCKCLACSPEECKAEAKQIAVAYVDMFHAKKTWRFPRGLGISTDDYRNGWMCYQWQTHTFNALESIVKKRKCFDIRRVGYVKAVSYPGYWEHHLLPGAAGGYQRYVPARTTLTLAHNWVAISAIKKVDKVTDRAAAGKCTVYLDPWKGNGPEAYCHTGVGYENGHRCHNFLGDEDGMVGDDPSRPQGIEGVYTQPNGIMVPLRFTGWTW